MKKMLMLMSVFVFGLCANAQITTNSSCDTNLNGTVSIEDVTNVANKVIGAPAKEAEVVTAAQLNEVLSEINKKLELLEVLKITLSSLAKNAGTRTPEEIEYELKYGVHEYVDLGLPSGTLWATYNIGASSPEEVGNYYAWGETAPKADNVYSYAAYSLCNGSSTTMTKYCTDSKYGTVDNLTELEAADDAATVNWGSEWQMPSSDQVVELFNSSYTTKEWTTVNGVNGYKVTSKISGYTDKSIFIPVSGYRTSANLELTTNGCYWTRSLNKSQNNCAYFMNISSSYAQTSVSYRQWGRPIRPVRVAKKVRSTTHEYVDLGFDSQTAWATCNIGANSPEEYGDYFAWGETTPQADHSYSWASYSLCEGTSTTMTKYCTNSKYGTVDNIPELLFADDAAKVNWGSDWRTPSIDQIHELIQNTKKEFTTVNGVKGYKFTSNKEGYTDKYIFLPAAGCYRDGELGSAGTYGYYWSRSFYLENILATAYDMYFYSGSVNKSFSLARYYGLPIRPVQIVYRKTF